MAGRATLHAVSFFRNSRRRGIVLLFVFFSIISLRAQLFHQVCDFETVPPGMVTNSLQIPPFVIKQGNNVNSFANCTLTNCCLLNPSRAMVINAPNGYQDVLIGNNYLIYSVFGSSPGLPAAQIANPQLNFDMKGSRFLRLNYQPGFGGQVEQLVGSFVVTPMQNFLRLAYLAVFGGAHNCCETAGFKMTLSGQSCFSINSSTCSTNYADGYFDLMTGDSILQPGLTANQYIFNKWKIKSIDLSQYMGQTFTYSLVTYPCYIQAHYSYIYLDAELGQARIYYNGNAVTTGAGTFSLINCTQNYTLSGEPYYFNYQWTGPGGFTSTNSVVVNNVPGTYTVTFDIDKTCPPMTRVITLVPPKSPVLVSSNPVCPGKQATITASGANTYTWSNGSNSSSITVNYSNTLNYTVLATDSAGCNNSATVSVGSLPSATVSANGLTLCPLTSDSLRAYGAQTYTWTGPGNLFHQGAKWLYTAGNFSLLSTFSVIGKDANGCVASAITQVSVHPSPMAQILLQPDWPCQFHAFSLTALATAQGTWTAPDKKKYAGLNFAKTSPNNGDYGVYTLNLKDANSCTAEYQKVVMPFSFAPYGILGRPQGCVPFCTELTAWASSPSSSFKWEVNTKRINGKALKVCFEEAGDHKVTLMLTDTVYGCEEAISTTVAAHGPPEVNFILDPMVVYENETVVLRAVNPDTSSNSYTWYFKGAIITHSTGSRAERTFNEQGDYLAVLRVLSNDGCSDTLIKIIHVFPEFLFYVPNIFTPNADGLNDVFVPISRGIKKYRLEIFDRWGEKLFESQDAFYGWDGTYKGMPCKTDSYAWVIQLSTLKDEQREYKGHVQIQR